MAQVTKIGVKYMLMGHWHNFRVFLSHGITWHEGASTSWLPFGGQLGLVRRARDQPNRQRAKQVRGDSGGDAVMGKSPNRRACQD
jgi:hypothetical protein